NEPMPLVVTAQELAFVLTLTHQEQEVAVGGLNVENGDLGLGLWLAEDLEEFALVVGLHIEGENPRRASPPGRTISDLQAWGNASEFGEEVRVHERNDTTPQAEVRSWSIRNMTGGSSPR